MSTREILTLQFGHYANYVGTHWWNVQELGFEYNTGQPSEINHDVLFREGLTNKKEVTFTPRLLLADLKGSLKSLSTQGTLYEPIADPADLQVNWNKPADVAADPIIPKSSYQKEIETGASGSYKLEDDVRVWSDFLYTRLHPRTVNVINEYQHEDDRTEFCAFPMGTHLWKTEAFQDDFADKIRNYVEECDSFQGFQILLDASNAFGGLAAACMQELSDEFENKSVLAVPLIPSFYSDYLYETEEDRHKSLMNDSVRVVNLGLCYAEMMEHSSLFIPLSAGSNGWRQPGPARQFSHVNYNSQLPYHSSAILAAALDTFTLKYRLKDSAYSLKDMSVDLSAYGRKAAIASLCLPFSLNLGADLIDCLDNWDGSLSKSITPNTTIGTSKLMQLITLRGVSEDRLKRPLAHAGKQMDMPAYKCNTITEMLKMYYAYISNASATDVTSVSKPLVVKKPFPAVFDDRIGFNGNVIATQRPDDIGVESVPVLTGLHCGSEMGESIEKLHTEMRKIKIAKFHQFISSGLEKDEFNECLDKLFDFREKYEDNYYI